MQSGNQAGPAGALPLALGTISFAVCFAAWGLIAAFAPRFRDSFHLSATQAALMVAVPVLLGSLARLPVGMLADRFGGRLVFSLLMVVCAIPAFITPLAQTYPQILLGGFFLGLAGSSFAVGVGFVSRWFSPEKQGSALGVYGLGNIGQSAAVFLGPLLAAAFGWQNIFRGVAAALLLWAVTFWLLARNAPVTIHPKTVGEMFGLLARERLSWALSAFYFLTFGGFVAFSIYLPSLLKDQFHLQPADAGFRTAGFVVLATVLRPLGGWLSDRVGGARVLSAVFSIVIPFALLLAWPSILPFTIGALGCAVMMGLGNGAVFKLVPQFFPRETGTVTGLVGAMGGLGGFFPPLLLGMFRDRMGTVWPAFVLLALVSLVMWRINARVFIPRQDALDLSLPAHLARVADRVRAAAWATLFTLVLVAAIVVGSRNLENFDPALVIYTFAVIFATWGVVYHYNVWLDKPPTRMYWRRGWELFRSQGVFRSSLTVAGLAGRNIVAQTFIAKRSRLRWWMHQCLFWGCILAAAITFPLVFGWIAFRSLPDDQFTYVTYLFGFPAGSFPLHTLVAFLLFHGLDVAAILVITGVFLSLWRRLQDKGAQSLQSFGMDFFPVILLFAISITGIALTVSQEWLRGAAYSFLAIIHAITVIAGLLFLPFGKFFHIFQRPAQLGVKLYRSAGEQGPGAICPRCKTRFASAMHVSDLKTVLPQLGFDYSVPGTSFAWQDLCPPCKRKTLSLSQLKLKSAAQEAANG
ncbi:MAG TPA: MFS transporter [Bryobacteraceae bacterium]|jgi:NNP family nitrate/nitrite transporter-like MFS transporter|nr:MFS transporter [Bryobacteraceae bacterium]